MGREKRSDGGGEIGKRNHYGVLSKEVIRFAFLMGHRQQGRSELDETRLEEGD